jgi:hypothetical protein
MNAPLDLLLLPSAIPAPVAALDLVLMLGFDPGGTPPPASGEAEYQPTFRPRRR